MKTSIIICTKDRKDDLFKAIRSIEAQTRIPDELIIVDASISQDFRSELLETFNRINIKYLHASPGLTKQRNLGIRASSGDIIVFFDDDVILHTEYLFYIEKVFAEDLENKIGGAMGKIININKNSLRFKLNQLYSKIFFLTSEGNGKLKSSGLPTHPFTLHSKNPIEVEVLSGAQMAYRREIFKYEMFDEKLSTYSYLEDVDFSYRIFKRGYKLIYQPKALIEHMVSLVSRLPKKEKKKMLIINHFYLFKKNCHPTFIKWVFFVWAQIGLFILACSSMKSENILGILGGWKEIIIKKIKK